MERKFGDPVDRIIHKAELARFAIFATAGAIGAKLAYEMTEDLRITVLTGVVAACAIDEARMSSKGE